MRTFLSACLAAAALAAAFLAAIALAAPAAAAPNGGNGNFSTEKPWDTDNLAYGGYSARNFRVPFHEYAGYASFSFTDNTTFQARAREACQSAIADGFFQAGGSVGAKNDFPVLSKTAGSWGDAETGSRSSGCGDFVAKQHQAATGTSGFYLDIAGNLRNGLPERSVGNYNHRSGSYTHWTDTATGRAYAHGFARAAARDSRIPPAVRHYGRWAYSAAGSFTRTPAAGHVGIVSPSDGYLARTDNYMSRVAVPQPTGGRWLPAEAAIDSKNERVVWWEADGTAHSWHVVHLSSAAGARFLPSSQDIGSDGSSAAFCPAGMHPRGQDGWYVIGASTGRSLSSLSTGPEARAADKYWCRSDVRYRLAYTAEEHTGHAPPPGVTFADDGDIFFAFGRSGCFYTAMSMSSGKCEYAFPVPRCADNGTVRDFTETELNGHTIGAEFSLTDDGTAEPPPPLASFTADLCVTASLEIYENRIAGGAAEPGVISSDRTLAVAAGRPAFDLDVTSPHPLTASASETTVWRPSGWAGSGSGWAVFDDTAHSAMTNGSLRRLSGEEKHPRLAAEGGKILEMRDRAT